MTEFNERIEGEIKTHEAEMLKKAVVAKYGAKSLNERILYIMDRYSKPSWSASEMFAKLTETELSGSDSIENIKKLFDDHSNNYPATVTSD
jgi:hypothetical protein